MLTFHLAQLMHYLSRFPGSFSLGLNRSIGECEEERSLKGRLWHMVWLHWNDVLMDWYIQSR